MVNLIERLIANLNYVIRQATMTTVQCAKYYVVVINVCYKMSYRFLI